MTTAVLEKEELPRTRASKDAIINVRVPRLLRNLIDSAADVVGKTRSEFILESARTHAVDVLIDRRMFNLDNERYDEFLRALDEPPKSNERLKQLLGSKAPWEKT